MNLVLALVLASIVIVVVMVATFPWTHGPCKTEIAQSRIPRKIHQTHKSAQFVQESPELRNAQKTWKQWPGWEHMFWSDEQAKAFVIREFGPRVARTLESLALPVMKADLFRYLVVYN